MTANNETIEQIFSELPTGHIIKVYRTEPTWCKGYLEEIVISDDENFSIEELKRKWGGKTFQLKVMNNGRYVTNKTVRIADIPRDNYQPLDPAYAETGNLHRNENGQFQRGRQDENRDPLNEFERFARMAQTFGWTPPNQAHRPPETEADIMAKKMVLDMMNAQSQQQMEMMRANMENQREMARWRREMADSDKPKEPLSDVKQTIVLLRELNGMKSEFGGDANPTTEIIQNAAPILETAVQELIELQKLKLQAELARVSHEQNSAPPLATRQPTEAARLAGDDAPRLASGGNGKADPVALARDMGDIYKALSPEDQRRVLSAFLGKVEETDENDGFSVADNSELDHNIVNPENVETLDPEDQAVLNGESDDDQNGDVQNGEHAAPISPND